MVWGKKKRTNTNGIQTPTGPLNFRYIQYTKINVRRQKKKKPYCGWYEAAHIVWDSRNGHIFCNVLCDLYIWSGSNRFCENIKNTHRHIPYIRYGRKQWRAYGDTKYKWDEVCDWLKILYMCTIYIVELIAAWVRWLRNVFLRCNFFASPFFVWKQMAPSSSMLIHCNRTFTWFIFCIL